MSLYYSPFGAEASVLQSVAAELEFGPAATVVRHGCPANVWHDFDPDRFGPARDPKTGVLLVISGRISLPREEWARARTLPYEGGLAGRVLLERYLKGGVEAVTPYNGPAMILVEDLRTRTTTVWTDQFGYHPCFLYQTDDPAQTVVTTFPDLILCDPSADHSLDLLSMAEFLRGWRAVPPNTYFERVKHVGAATRTTIDLANGDISSMEYWRPFEDEFYPNIDAAADALATAIESAIKERTDFANNPVFMVSGGADSRVLLFSTANRGKVTGVNLYERLADETAVAEVLCQLAGTKFVALQRDRDFYPRLLPEIVRWSGGMWSAEDSHYYGFASEFNALGTDLVMTACTTDWVFKGYGLEKAYLKLGKKNLPFHRLTKDREEGFLPNRPTPPPPEITDELQARLETWFAGCPDALESPRDFLKVEDRRIRPACYTVSVSGQIMARTFPYDTFLADSRVAECYSRIHPDWKLNREVWGKAAARICLEAGRVVDSNYGWPVDATIPQKALKFVTGWLRRRLVRISRTAKFRIGDEERAPSSGSWPDCGWYAYNSATLEALWAGASPEHRDRMRMISGDDPWSRPLGALGKDGHRLMRYSTLLAHWNEIEARKKRASLFAVV